MKKTKKKYQLFFLIQLEANIFNTVHSTYTKQKHFFPPKYRKKKIEGN